jgi:hypothetical protein
VRAENLNLSRPSSLNTQSINGKDCDFPEEVACYSFNRQPLESPSISAVSSKIQASDFQIMEARTTPQDIGAQIDATDQRYKRRIQEKGRARAYIASLDKEGLA